MVNVQKLHPAFQLLLVLVKHEFAVGYATEESDYALVLFFHQLRSTGDAKARAEDTELPSGNGMSISAGGAVIQIKFEPRPVEANRLAYGADVCIFQRQEDGQPPNGLFGITLDFGDERKL